MKTTYTSAFKAQVVLELLKEEKTISQLTAEYKVHPNVLRDWRTLAVKNLATLFDKHDDVASLRAAHEQQLEDLYAQIGRLTSQLTWIKKKAGLDPDKS
jgi:putative transposase